jgi:hypothetical protein
VKVDVEELVVVVGELDSEVEFVFVGKILNVGMVGVATVARVVLV